MPGKGIGISPMLKNKVPMEPLTPITIAWVAKVISLGGTVTNTELRYVNRFTSNSQFSKLDLFVLNGARNRIAAKVDVVNPNVVFTEVSSPQWVAGVGFSKGTAGYLDTNWNPFTQGVNYTLNNAFTGIYFSLLSNDTNGGQDLAAFSGPDLTGNGTQLLARLNNTLQGSVNSTNVIGAGNNENEGFMCQGRSDGLNSYVVVRGSKSSFPNPVSGIPNLNLFLLSLNYNGVAATNSIQTAALTVTGAGDVDHVQLNIDIQNLMNNLGISPFFFLIDSIGNYILNETEQNILVQ